MNRMLIAAVVASCGSSAVAGPMLDNVLRGHAYQAGSEEITDARESYLDFSTTLPEGDMKISQLILANEVDTVILEMTGVTVEKNNGETSFIDRLRVETGPDMVGELHDYLDALDETGEEIARRLGAEDCSAPTDPLTVVGDGIRMKAPNGQSSDIGTFFLSYALIDPDAGCVIDASIGLSDIRTSDPSGMDFTLGAVEFSLISPMSLVTAPKDEVAEYGMSLAAQDIAVSMSGADQFGIDRVAVTGTSDAASVIALHESGYYEFMAEITANGDLPSRNDISGEELVRIWDGIRSASSTSTFEISGAKIVGELPQLMTGIPALSPGRSLDALIKAEQDQDDIHVNIDLSSAGLADIAVGFSMALMDLDPGVGNMSKSVILMSAPIAISEAKVALSDEGLGEIVEMMTGSDPYAEAGRLVSSNLGPKKGEIISGWLSAAQNGGATFVAKPGVPLPLMQAFVGFMGDWTSFGAMINAQSTP